MDNYCVSYCGGKPVVGALTANNELNSELNFMQVKISVDAKGLKCPMPLLKAKQALNKVKLGEVVEVLATDSASMKDIQSYAEMSEHDLVLAVEEKGIFRYQLKKQC